MYRFVCIYYFQIFFFNNASFIQRTIRFTILMRPRDSIEVLVLLLLFYFNVTNLCIFVYLLIVFLNLDIHLVFNSFITLCYHVRFPKMRGITK